MIDQPIQKHLRISNWWVTESEKVFLANLGTFCRDDRTQDKKERRMRLLVNYRSSIPNRKDWGSIDPKEILTYVDMLIIRAGLKGG